MIFIQEVSKELVQQQDFEVWIAIIRLLDLAKETAANDATTSPHEGDSSHIQIPALLFGRLAQQHVALRIRNDFRAVKRATHILDETLLILSRPFRRTL